MIMMAVQTHEQLKQATNAQEETLPIQTLVQKYEETALEWEMKSETMDLLQMGMDDQHCEQ